APQDLSLAGALADGLEALRADFELECPGLCAGWLLRALRAQCGRVVVRLREVLQQVFARLRDHGRCLVVSVTRYQMEAVRRFVHDHEDPLPQLDLCPERLAELYPALLHGAGYSVRIAGGGPAQCAGRALVHVLERVPAATAAVHSRPLGSGGGCGLASA
ncbi:unnamed protein product, partial [Prorocentrum cordatum]